MTESEIIEQVCKYFTKDKGELKEIILNYDFDSKKYRNWVNFFSKNTNKQPFDITNLMMNEQVERIVKKNYDDIDWNFIGDLSWEIEILLNEGVLKGYDWDKKMCLKCGGTARILRVFISDILPVFIFETYSMTYSKQGNYYEFQPIKLEFPSEKSIVNKIISDLKREKYYNITRKLAAKRLPNLYSDCNTDGNATIFDVLFSDVKNILTGKLRYSDSNIKILDDKEFCWREYYGKDGVLKKRIEHWFFDSKNVLKIETNNLNDIRNVVVWKDTNKQVHKEFKMNLPPKRSLTDGS